ncbi:vanadium-dependent haloperoxidase [Algoriphagus sp.]|uniref:vanadium-dependent haloperoxidase n=1 Tax=Algoriphagus sp. TaxID=1872435 RepID=UPI00261D9514|nr:vanadium-dependent haloperoxidase [Algoriphagus sp.]
MNMWKNNLNAVRLLLLMLGMSLNVFAADKKAPNWPKIYSDHLFQLTEVMVTDVASPPVAARIYAYAALSSYLLMESEGAVFERQKIPVSGPFTRTASGIPSPEFAAVYAMLLVGEKLMPSGYLLQEKQENWIDQGIKLKIIKRGEVNAHVQKAQQIASEVLALAGKDGYKELTALNRYTPKEGPGNWYPTPPAYIAAVEPEWKTMKPFFIQELDQFDPEPMAEFDLAKGSSFQRQLQEVYEVGKNLSEEQKLIANFWDCNPFKVTYSGHMAMGVKKISPGGHWMGITGIAAQKAQLNFQETAYIHALVGMTLHDAFISCWKAKYETNRIRPETVINRTLNQRWKPLLQTPPFPEYTSGHSVISQASAVILSSYFGNNFSFLDTSEVYFGLPERQFDSFFQASSEAAISRLYGGIHFRDAIEEGLKQGDKIAKMILDKLKIQAQTGSYGQ